MNIYVVLFVLGIGLHSGRCDCSLKTSTLAENTNLYCEAGPSCLGGFVFRGKPTADPVNTTLPANSIREDEFTIIQLFKGSWSVMDDGDKIIVKYSHTTTNCNNYPYDQDGMENVIYGYFENNKVNIYGCENVKVYDCMEDQATFNTYTSVDPCNDGGCGFF